MDLNRSSLLYDSVLLPVDSFTKNVTNLTLQQKVDLIESSKQIIDTIVNEKENEVLEYVTNMDRTIHEIVENITTNLPKEDKSSPTRWKLIISICEKLVILMKQLYYQNHTHDTFIIGVICEDLELVKRSLESVDTEDINNGIEILACKLINNIDNYSKVVNLLIEYGANHRKILIDTLTRSKLEIVMHTFEYLLDEGILNGNDVGRIGINTLNINLVNMALKWGANLGYALEIIDKKLIKMGMFFIHDNNVRKIVKLLLDRMQIKDMDLLLKLSVFGGWIDIAFKAIKNGANVSKRINYILTSTALPKYCEMLLLLLKNYPQSNKFLMNEVLTFAVKAAHMDLANYALKNGADNINDQLKYLADMDEMDIYEGIKCIMGELMKNDNATDMVSVIIFAEKCSDENIKTFALSKMEPNRLEMKDII